MPRALVRPPSAAYARCLRSDGAAAVDSALAARQHEGYRRALAACATLVELPPEPDLPDACFVEDAAVVRGGVAAITRPGAPSRAPETASVARALAGLLDVRPMERGRLDGGDVLQAGGRLFVGLSERTDAEGARELGRVLGVEPALVPLGRWLHLKTPATPLGPDAVIQARGAYPPGTFGGVEVLETDELLGANVLAVGDDVLVSAAAPRTAELLARRGRRVRVVEASQFHAGDAGMTCLSIVLP